MGVRDPITRGDGGEDQAGMGPGTVARPQGPAPAASVALGVASPRCAHQGFFTVGPSSSRKPFCSIHLSLRNLDLRGQAVSRAGHRVSPPSLPQQGAQFPQKAQDPSQTPPVQERLPRGWSPDQASGAARDLL